MGTEAAAGASLGRLRARGVSRRAYGSCRWGESGKASGPGRKSARIRKLPLGRVWEGFGPGAKVGAPTEAAAGASLGRLRARGESRRAYGSRRWGESGKASGPGRKSARIRKPALGRVWEGFGPWARVGAPTEAAAG